MIPCSYHNSHLSSTESNLRAEKDEVSDKEICSQFQQIFKERWEGMVKALEVNHLINKDIDVDVDTIEEVIEET